MMKVRTTATTITNGRSSSTAARAAAATKSNDNDDHHRHHHHRHHHPQSKASFQAQQQQQLQKSQQQSQQQAWDMLRRHGRDEIFSNQLRLRELCSSDERVSALVSVFNSTTTTTTTSSVNGQVVDVEEVDRLMMVDLSRQFITIETMNKLMYLSFVRGIKEKIQRLAWGPSSSSTAAEATTAMSNNHTSGSSGTSSSSSSFPSFHLSLRVPKNIKNVTRKGTGRRNSTDTTTTTIPTVMYDSDGQTNVLSSIHGEWDRIQQLSEKIRRGQPWWDGGSSSSTNNHNPMIRDVIVVGKGTPIMMLRFVYLALCKDTVATIGRRAGSTTTSFSASSSSSGIGPLGISNPFDPSSSKSSTNNATGNARNTTIHRRIKFLTTCDPVRAAAVTADSDPASTLVITLQIKPSSSSSSSSTGENDNSDNNNTDNNSDGDDDEVKIASKTLQTWLIAHLGQNGRRSTESILNQHMMWVTTSSSSSTTSSSSNTEPSSKTAPLATSVSQSSSYQLDSNLQPQQPHHSQNHQQVEYQPSESSIFRIPHHSRTEPFCSLTAASLVPLSIVFGWHVVEQLLDGAHKMDCHFVETNPRHNLPVLLALTDVWNDTCFPKDHGRSSGRHSSGGTGGGGGAAGRVVTPFTEAFAAYPAFVATLESQTCSRSTATTASTETSTWSQPGNSVPSCPPIVVDGGLHGMYDRATFQGSNVLPSELVMTLDSQLATNSDPKLGTDQVYRAQDALICSFFAHADQLAFGPLKQQQSQLSPSSSENTPPLPPSAYNDPMIYTTSTTSTSSLGNRPSTLLLCDKLDAYACGQFVALAEHRVLVKSWLLGIDPYVMTSGTTLRSQRMTSLQRTLQRMIIRGPEYTDGDDDDDDDHYGGGGGGDDNNDNTAFGGGTSSNNGESSLNLSTRTILRHYANMVSGQRMHPAN